MIKTLSTQERVAIARDYVARVFNGRNAERAREFFTPDVVWHGGALGTVTGVDTIVPVLGGFIGALTGIKSEVQDVIASNDLVALASEEVAIRAVIPHEIDTWDPYDEEVRVWRA